MPATSKPLLLTVRTLIKNAAGLSLDCAHHATSSRHVMAKYVDNARRATRILFWVIIVMGGLVVAHTAAWAFYKHRGWRLPRLLPFPRLEVYFAMFMLAPMATCAGRACCRPDSSMLELALSRQRTC